MKIECTKEEYTELITQCMNIGVHGEDRIERCEGCCLYSVCDGQGYQFIESVSQIAGSPTLK